MMNPKNNMDGGFANHGRKIIFRKKWAKPILDAFKNKLGKKLIYLGLPGTEALDVKEWIDSIYKVIAFICDEGESEPKAIDVLNGILNEFETKEILSNYSLYNGYIEEVVLTGIDQDLAPFSQSDFVTLYNLDFCNPLQSPFKRQDEYGNVKKYHKIETIDKLLSIEKERAQASNGDTGFIMFLTVNAKFWEDSMGAISDSIISTYIKNLGEVSGESREIRLLKAYTYYFLNLYFQKYGFNAEFLPPIYYEGVGGYYTDRKFNPHWLMTFTIFGTFVSEGASTQGTENYLKSKFLFANNVDIKPYTDRNKRIKENECQHIVDKLIEESETYKKMLVTR